MQELAVTASFPSFGVPDTTYNAMSGFIINYREEV